MKIVKFEKRISVCLYPSLSLSLSHTHTHTELHEYFRGPFAKDVNKKCEIFYLFF